MGARSAGLGFSITVHPIRKILALLAIVLVYGTSHADALEIKTEEMVLEFAADGQPKSLKMKNDVREHLNVRSPGEGFVVQGYAFNYGRSIGIPLNDLSYDGEHLIAQNGHVKITLAVRAAGQGILFEVKRVEGLSKKNRLWLRFNINCNKPIKVLPLDAVTDVSRHHRLGTLVDFPLLWKRAVGVPMGRFAIVPSSLQYEEARAEQYASDRKRLIGKAWYQDLKSEVGKADETVQIDSGQYSIRILDDGSFASLKYKGRELLLPEKGRSGFWACGYNHETKRFETYPLGHVRSNGKQLFVQNGPYSILFDIVKEEHYVAFRINRTTGFEASDLTWYKFDGAFKPGIEAFPLDYMTACGKQNEHIQVNWRWAWGRGKDLPTGGFALIAADSDEAFDEALYHIWVNEGLPHSKVEGEWDLARAKQWMEDWQQENQDRSRMLLSAKSMEDLFYLADMAEALDIKEIYLHTDTWRGEYWPQKRGFLTVNPEVFPQGDVDFRRFSSYLKQKGIGLAIHTVSCSIANQDPDYSVPQPDRRFAKWITGSLAKPISATDRTIYLQAPTGAELPMNLTRSVTGPEHVDSWNNYKSIRIGDEIMTVGKFTDTDQPIWKLENVWRNHATATAHASGESVDGLLRPYNKVYTAGANTDMMEEVARRYAEFCNRNGVTHSEQDAGEIHSVEQPWGYAKFAQYVYQHLDHRVTSNNSGGSPMPSQLEYKFRKSADVVKSRKAGGISMILDKPSRVATGPYDNSLSLSGAAAKGATNFGIGKPEAMFGITREILTGHGLTDTFIQNLRDWKAVTPLLNDAQRSRLGHHPVRQNNYGATHEVYDITSIADGYQITPKQLMRRPTDSPWGVGIEYGIVAPRQYVVAGNTLNLNNPFAAGEPEVIIRVLPGFGEGNSTAGTTGKASDEKLARMIEDYRTGVGLQNERHPLEGAHHIWGVRGVRDGQAMAGTCWLRKKFTLPKDPDSAFLSFHVNDEVIIYMNGRIIGTQRGDDQGYVADVAKYLQAGENIIAVEVTNLDGDGCFAAALKIECGGERIDVVSDSSWLSHRMMNGAWLGLDLDESGWRDSSELAEFGKGGWGRPKMVPLVRQATQTLQPKASQIKAAGDHQFSDEGHSLRIRYSNQRALDKTYDTFANWRATGHMRGARGVGLTIDGDNSGALLVVRLHAQGRRDYIVPIDFEGRREIVIPNGEVAWSDSRWGWKITTSGMGYGIVSSVSMGFGRVPKETDVDIQVSNLRLLNEVETELVNPEVRVGAGMLQLTGRIGTDQYLWYNGGSTAGVYDRNWNKLKDLPVRKQGFTAEAGMNDVSVHSPESQPMPWLECQFFVRDAPMPVTRK